MAAGHHVEYLDEDHYIEFDEDGVPLGEWHWDEDMEEWIFDEYPPPLAGLPSTDGFGVPLYRQMMFIFGLLYFVLDLSSRYGAKAPVRHAGAAVRH